MLALLPVLYIAGSPTIVICCPIKNIGNPDLVILKTVYLDQGDPVQCCFEKPA